MKTELNYIITLEVIIYKKFMHLSFGSLGKLMIKWDEKKELWNWIWYMNLAISISYVSSSG